MGQEQHGEDPAGERRYPRREDPGRSDASALRRALRARAMRHHLARELRAHQRENEGEEWKKSSLRKTKAWVFKNGNVFCWRSGIVLEDYKGPKQKWLF